MKTLKFVLIIIAFTLCNLNTYSTGSGKDKKTDQKPKKGSISNGVSWQLIEISGEDGSIKNVTHSKASLKFNVPQGKFTGNSSCNSIFGTVLIDGLTIKISEVGSTKMACTDLISSKIEMLFVGNLQKANNYTVKNNKLTLMYDKTVLAVLKKI